MKKKGIVAALLFLSVGFAAVSTNLFINGSTSIKSNKDDFHVYYSNAKVNGTQDLSVVESETKLSFKTTLDEIGETYVLDYDVTNGSRIYDAALTMSCTAGNNYLTVTNSFDTSTNLGATKTRSGKLTLQLTKSYTGSDLDVAITCTLNANAVERTSLGEGTAASPVEKTLAYYAFGRPTTSSPTDYTTLGKNVFVRLDSNNSLAICINDGGLFCIKNNDYENSAELLKDHFGEEKCTPITTVTGVNCSSDSFTCIASSNGYVDCIDNEADEDCNLRADGVMYCS